MNQNIVILSGRISQGPELRTTQNGINFCNFNIAVDSLQKDDNGEKKSNFFPCVAWRGTADIIYKYVTKGDKITISGKLDNKSYIDKENKKRIVTQIIVDEVDFMPSRNGKVVEEPKADIPEPLKNFEPVDDDNDNLPF